MLRGRPRAHGPGASVPGDEALLTLQLDRDAFTVRLQDLAATGPVWHPADGVFITRTDQDTSFRDYRAHHRGEKTLLQRVGGQPEQSFAGAFYGQPRGHAVNYSLGCAHSPQRFWVEANGDVLLHRENLDFLGRKPELAGRFLNRGSARFFFGFERWIACARFDGPSPAPVYTLQFKNAGIMAEETVLCVPLLRSIREGDLSYHDPTVALVRLRFQNTGALPARAVLPVRYSQESVRSQNALHFDPAMDDYLVPRSTRDPVTLEDGCLTTDYQGASVLRAIYASAAMEPARAADGSAVLARTLQPGESYGVGHGIHHVEGDHLVRATSFLITQPFATKGKEMELPGRLVELDAAPVAYSPIASSVSPVRRSFFAMAMHSEVCRPPGAPTIPRRSRPAPP